MTNERGVDLVARLGTRFEVRAIHVGERIDIRGIEPRVSPQLPAIEPLAIQMKSTPRKLPWKQPDLVRQIGDSMLVEHQLVGRAEILEKPDLLWDQPELDRLYARLEDEYELRERVLALERKLEVVSRAATTMLDLHQARRSLNVEYYIVVLIAFEIALALIQLVRGGDGSAASAQRLRRVVDWTLRRRSRVASLSRRSVRSIACCWQCLAPIPLRWT
jgi:hypothetical protein